MNIGDIVSLIDIKGEKYLHQAYIPHVGENGIIINQNGLKYLQGQTTPNESEKGLLINFDNQIFVRGSSDSIEEYLTSGYVFDEDSIVLSDEQINITGYKIGNTDSNSSGYYVFNRLRGNENFKVEPDRTDRYEPEYYVYYPLTENKFNQDFYNRCRYTIQGQVYDTNGSYIVNHLMNITGNISNPITDITTITYTNADGLYNFIHLCKNDSYVVYPDERWYFYPTHYEYSPLDGFKTGQDFNKGVTFYQKDKSINCNGGCGGVGNFWPGGGSFPIPGEDFIQKVRFGATATLKEGSESPHQISFWGAVYQTGETLWNIAFSSIPETAHAEVFYLGYDPSMTPDGFSVGYWYHDQWHFWDKKFCDVHMEIEFLYEESNPSVETLEATNVTDATATLNGKLNEVGWQECTVWFEWGEFLLAEETGHVSFSLKYSFSASISGLTPSTGYFFRAVVQSGGNTFWGSVKYFTTLP